jgi:hypothetical protein
LMNLSCASGILFESILRLADPQNGFHTAKTLSGPKGPFANPRAFQRRLFGLLWIAPPIWGAIFQPRNYRYLEKMQNSRGTFGPVTIRG